jgi:uncharacterized NAD(P)/FAD-binding protein YdhS
MGARMTPLAPLAPKISPLTRLFGSDQDGEVLGAVRAVDRKLKRAGLDWHALVDALEDNRAPDEPQTWRDLARWCRDHDAGRLKPHERAFVADMTARLVCGGMPSEKQAAWLRCLYARLNRGDA